MKAYFTQTDDRSQAVRDDMLHIRLQRRLEAARGNAALMNQLEREAATLACGAKVSERLSASSKTDRLDRTLAMLRH
ncbi:MAG: hypothetical protein AAFX40_03590 [Cyanobacteria bacterium J06639_1]